MSSPNIQLVSYQNPAGPLPTNISSHGISIFINAVVGYVLVARLMDGTEVLSIGVSNKGSSQFILSPGFILGKNRSYYLQAQFVQVTGNYNPTHVIDSVKWSDSSTITVSLLTEPLELSKGLVSIEESTSTLILTFEWANQFPISCLAQLYIPGPIEPTATYTNNSLRLSHSYTGSLPSSITAVLRSLLPMKSPQSWPSQNPRSSPFLLGSGLEYTIPTIHPEINNVNYNGKTITVTWPAPNGVSEVAQYELLLTDSSGNVISSCTATQAGGALALTTSDGTSANYFVCARISYGVIKGPLSTKVPVVCGNVSQITQTTDPSNGFSTISWVDDSSQCTSYTKKYNLTFGSGTPAKIPLVEGTSKTLTQKLANSPNTVSISVTATSGSVTTQGPSSIPKSLGVSLPNILTAQFDGSKAHASWQALADNVTSYTITLLTGGTINSTQEVPGSATNISFTPSTNLAPGDSPTLVLQATKEEDIGPGLPSTPSELTFVTGYYFQNTVQAIYSVTELVSLPPSATNGNDSVIYLPKGNYLKQGKSFEAVTDNNALSLQANTGTNASQYPYTLTIVKGTWDITAPGIRSVFQTHYIDFLQNCEGAANFNAWGILVLQEAIARHMPQTFEETLYYSYGINLTGSSQKYADLRPGMILRLLPSDYIVVPGPDRNGQKINYLNGYVNSSPIDFEIGSYGHGANWRIGFDAFISKLVSAGVLTVNAPDTRASQMAGVASGADLYYPSNLNNAFYRLFFPGQLLSPTGPGSALPVNHFNLASAESFTSLQTTTNSATNNSNAYFRGRPVLSLCIRVSVNGQDSVVPIGTTVANLLERYGRMVPAEGLTITGLDLKRSLGRATIAHEGTVNVNRFNSVHFDYQPLPAYGLGNSALDLPLLHGDILTFTN